VQYYKIWVQKLDIVLPAKRVLVLLHQMMYEEKILRLLPKSGVFLGSGQAERFYSYYQLTIPLICRE
jgi:hypothetical protein